MIVVIKFQKNTPTKVNYAFFFAFFSVSLVFLCLQTTILNSFPLIPIKPDITIIMVAYFAIFHRPVRGIILAFFLGCLMDVLSGTILGVYMLLRICTFAMTRLVLDTFYFKTTFSQMLLTVALSIIDGVLLLLVLNIFGSIDNMWPFVLLFLPLQSLVTGIMTPVIFLLLKKTEIFIESS